MWKWDHKVQEWTNTETGEVLKNFPEGGGKSLNPLEKINKVISKKGKDSKDEKACPGHKDSILVLKKNVKVYAGSASKTENLPKGALILDLADKYGNGLKAEGLTLPPSLQSRRVIFDWPDMSKPYLYQTEWEDLAAWLKDLPVVQEFGLYVACLEGHGRTGTALCILAHYFGEWSDNIDMVRHIRKLYCPRAVETSTQIEYFEKMTGRKTKCVGSNAGTTTYTGYYKPTPCYKTTNGVTTDCQHNCTAQTSTHKEHWCGKCKWDWYVDNQGLHEKPGPGNPHPDKEWVITPGSYVVRTLNEKGELVFTETWDQDGSDTVIEPKQVEEVAEAKETCWDTNPFALGSDGSCEDYQGEHVCTTDKGHPGRHVCGLCGGVWDSNTVAGEEEIPTPYVNGPCLAVGGQEPDHKCLCTKEIDHEDVLWSVHTCSTCSKDFEEDITDD